MPRLSLPRLACLATLLACCPLPHAAAAAPLIVTESPSILLAGMQAPSLFGAVVRLTPARSLLTATLSIAGHRLSQHWLRGSSQAVSHTFVFDLRADGVPRFSGPARYTFCAATGGSKGCATGVIPLPAAVIHGIFGDLAVLEPSMDPYPPLLAALRQAGYSDTAPYRTLAYVQYPSATALLDLLDPTHSLAQLIFGTGVEDYAARYLAPEIDRLLAESYATRVDLVGHSMGGLLARAYIAAPADAARVRRVILLGTPSQGSTATFEELGARAGLSATGRDLLPIYPYLQDATTGQFLAPPIRNSFLARLTAQPRPAVQLICIYERDRATPSVLVVRYAGGSGVAARYQVLRVRTEMGDGTVTVRSAIVAGARLIPLADGTPHAELPRDPAVRRLIVALLAR